VKLALNYGIAYTFGALMKNPAKKKTESFSPLLLLCFTLLFLWMLSCIPSQFLMVNSSLKLRKLNLFSAIEILPKFKTKKHLIINSESTDPSDLPKMEFVVSEDSLWVDYSEANINSITSFFQKLLKKEKKKKIRIAYFGDSMIEGDLIVRDFRNLMQQKYGGSGVGLVPLTSPTAGFRQTIQHSFSQNWTEFNLLLKNNLYAPGITGHVFIPQTIAAFDSIKKPEDASWCSFYPVAAPLLHEFKKTSIFFGPSTSENYVFINGRSGQSKVFSLKGNAAVNKLEIPQNLAGKGLTLTFATKEKLPIYAVNFDADSGIFVDNFSFRGNSGMPLTRIPFANLNGMNQLEPYDLIILQYGLNAASASVSDYNWYEAGLRNMIAHMKNCFPNAALLMITPGDKSMKENGEWVTDPGLKRVIEAEKNVAKNTGITFYNFYLAMGGQNSMVQWAESNPPKANKDYTHFNFRGASIAGKMIFNAVEKAKTEFEKQEKISTSTKLPSLR
jgi:hypothetical protein